MLRIVVAGVATILPLYQAHAAPSIDRGKYLVSLGGCSDCHTPGSFLGQRDASRLLGGSEVGFQIPDLGTFYGPNLTPDKDTGLGNWTLEQIETAITRGITPDNRRLAPAMPFDDFAALTKEDAESIALYLKSLPPVHNQVPGPFGPNDKPTSFVMKVVAPEK